jgi:hypothetical protein
MVLLVIVGAIEFHRPVISTRREAQKHQGTISYYMGWHCIGWGDIRHCTSSRVREWICIHRSTPRYRLENNLAQVNETSELGLFDTPLEAAASGGHLSVVQMLVENGAVIVARGRRDRVFPPLNAAIWRGRSSVFARPTS